MAATDDGFYWARTDRYEISAFDSVGNLKRLTRRAVEPIVLTRSERARYVEGTLAALREDGRDDTALSLAQSFRVAEYAETRPLFWTAFVDLDRRLWVSSWPWPARFRPPTTWSVFSTEGWWLGDVLAPERVFFEDAEGDTVLGSWTDDLGVSYLRLYRLSGD
jgi:hypothetical protein